MQHLKECVYRLTNHLQLVMGHIEERNYGKALDVVRLAVSDLQVLGTLLSRNVISTSMPRSSVVVVPHGTRVVSSDDMVTHISPDAVEVAPESDVKPGQGKQNRKTI